MSRQIKRSPRSSTKKRKTDRLGQVESPNSRHRECSSSEVAVRRNNEVRATSADIPTNSSADLGTLAAGPASLHVPARLPPTPSSVRKLKDPALRQRAQEVWRVANRLVLTLDLWTHYLYFAANRIQVDDDTSELITRLFPRLANFQRTLGTVVAIDNGERAADGNLVGEMVESFAQQVRQLAISLDELFPQICGLDDAPCTITSAISLMATIQPMFGRRSLFPNQLSKRVARVGQGELDIDFGAMFQAVPQNIVPLKLRLSAFLELLAESPLAALKVDAEPENDGSVADRESRTVRDPAMEARDEWIYDECCKLTKYSAIVNKLKRKAKSWRRLGSAQSIKSAATAYAKRHGLPPIPKRARGRSSKK